MTAVYWATPLVVFVGFAAVLSVIDIKQHILPNRIVALGLLSVLGAECALALIVNDWTGLRQSLLVSVQMMLIYVGLLILSRGRLGMGDVKFSALTGLAIGWTAPHMWLGSIWLAFSLAALWALAGKYRGWIDRHSAIAFGPFMSIAVLPCAFISAVHL